MMRFEVGNVVGHIVLAGEKGLLPQGLAIAQDAAGAADVGGQLAQQEFGAERGGAELGMGEPEVIVAFGYMVAELVGEREAEAVRRAVLTD